jgi:hypothetical protein
MFNKIVASVISSVVLFACNVKEDATVDAADVVAVSQDVSAPEASKTEAVVQPGVITSVPAATPSVATPAGEVAGGAAPLVAPAAGAGAASGVTSTVTPTSSGLTAGAPSTLPAATSTTTVPVK